MPLIKHKLPETREEWLAQRQTGIGGSDAGAILGMNKWKSAYALWAEKTGILNKADEDSCYLRDGRMLEDSVARLFSEETGMRVQKSSFSYEHPEYSWMKANIDRWIKPGKIGLEIKTMDVRKQIDLDGGDVPPSYYA